jgi:hypothetical protein
MIHMAPSLLVLEGYFKNRLIGFVLLEGEGIGEVL